MVCGNSVIIIIILSLQNYFGKCNNKVTLIYSSVLYSLSLPLLCSCVLHSLYSHSSLLLFPLFFVFSLFSVPLSSILYLLPLLCSSVLHSVSSPFLEFLPVFCFFYAIDGVVRERGFEVLAVPIAISVVIIYLIVNYIYEGLDRQPIRLVRIR